MIFGRRNRLATVSVLTLLSVPFTAVGSYDLRSGSQNPIRSLISLPFAFLRQRSSPNRLCLLILPIVALICALVSPPASAETGRPNAKLDPEHVAVDIFLLDLDEIDSHDQSFQANIYFEATWNDLRLADEKREVTVTRRLDEAWHPRLQIVNQQRVWSSLPDVVEIAPDGSVTQRARIWGDFSQPLDLREFPFDNQSLQILVVTAGFSDEEIILSPGPSSGIGKTFSIADWEITDWQMTTNVEVPGPEGARSAGVAMALQVQRLRGYYWIKVIAPLVLIVAMSWAVFWIDPKETGTKISITITAMLTLIAYRFAIDNSLPAISYLTRMDLFILFSAILIYASLVAVVVTAAYERKEKTSIAKGIDRASRWGFPLIFIVSWVVSMRMPL